MINGKLKRGKDFFSKCNYTKVSCWVQLGSISRAREYLPVAGLNQDDGTYSGSSVGSRPPVPVVWERPSRPQGGVGVLHFIGTLGTGYLGSVWLWDLLGR